MASTDIVGYSDLTLLVPHAVSLIVLEQKTDQTMICLFLTPQFYPQMVMEKNTDCLKFVPQDQIYQKHLCKIQILSRSASCNPDTGNKQVGFSVVTAHATLITKSLPASLSAQEAEFIVLIEACKLAKDKTVNI